MKRLLVALLLALTDVSNVAAHVTSTGLAVLEVNDGRLSYRLTVVATEQEEDVRQALLAAADGDPAAAARVAQVMRERACQHVGIPTRRERDDHRDRTRGPRLGECRGGQCQRAGERKHHGAASCAHDVLPAASHA